MAYKLPAAIQKAIERVPAFAKPAPTPAPAPAPVSKAPTPIPGITAPPAPSPFPQKITPTPAPSGGGGGGGGNGVSAPSPTPDPVATYDPRFGGVITSTGEIYSTTDPSFVPKGFVAGYGVSTKEGVYVTPMPLLGGIKDYSGGFSTQSNLLSPQFPSTIQQIISAPKVTTPVSDLYKISVQLPYQTRGTISTQPTQDYLTYVPPPAPTPYQLVKEFSKTVLESPIYAGKAVKEGASKLIPEQYQYKTKEITSALPYQTRGTSYYAPETGYYAPATTQKVAVETPVGQIPEFLGFGTMAAGYMAGGAIGTTLIGAGAVYGGTQIYEGIKQKDIGKAATGSLFVLPAAFIGGKYALAKEITLGIKPIPKKLPTRIGVITKTGEEGMGISVGGTYTPAQESFIQRRVSKWFGFKPEVVQITKPRTDINAQLFAVSKEKYVSAGVSRKVSPGTTLQKLFSSAGKIEEIPIEQVVKLPKPYSYVAGKMPLRALGEDVTTYISFGRMRQGVKVPGLPLSVQRISKDTTQLFFPTRPATLKEAPYYFGFGRVKPLTLSPYEDFVTLYHGTTKESAARALIEGLKPAKEVGISRGLPVKLPEVYATPSLERAQGWAGRAFIGKGKVSGGGPSVLEIKVPRSEYEKILLRKGIEKGGGEEVALKKISPKYLRIFGTEPPKVEYFVGETGVKVSAAYVPKSAGKVEYGQQLIMIKRLPDPVERAGTQIIGGKQVQITQKQMQTLAGKVSLIAEKFPKSSKIPIVSLTPQLKSKLGISTTTLALPRMVGGSGQITSQYIGTGEYERTAGGLLPAELQKTGTAITRELSKQSEEVSSSLKIKLEQKGKEGIRYGLAGGVTEIPRMAQPQTHPQREITRIIQIPKQVQITKQIQRVPRIRIDIPRLEPPRIRTPPRVDIFPRQVGKRTEPFGMRRKVLIDGFVPEIRRRGKFMPIAPPTTKEKALFLGKTAVRKTLGASLRIRGPKGFVTFAPQEEFRLGKRAPQILVQTKGRRLSSPFEVREIQASRRKIKWM